MRRTFASLLFGLAYVGASLAVGGWLLQRTAFSPDRTSRSAQAVLDDPQIRAQVVDLVANATADRLCGAPENAALCRSPDKVREMVNGLLESPATSAAMSQQMARILHDAHAHLIGAQPGPVQITDLQMRDIVRNESVIGLPPITLPVPEISALSVVRVVLGWLIPIAGIAAIVLGIAGLIAHPDRTALMRSLGYGMLLLAVIIVGLGYLVPRFVVPAMSRSAWARVPITLADDNLPFVLGIDFMLVGGGLALLAAAGLARRRRRWSTPVSTYRYNQERNWG